MRWFVQYSLSGDTHGHRPLHKIQLFYFTLFFVFVCQSVVGTSGLAPSLTSGPLILPVLGKI